MDYDSTEGVDIMAKGRLTNVERFAIQGMVADNVSAKDIAKELGRTTKTVENYLEKLDGIHDTVAKVQHKKLKDLQDEIDRQSEELKRLNEQKNTRQSLDEIKQKVYERINSIPGLAQGTSFELVERVLKNNDPQTEEELFALAIRELNAKDVMIRETGAKREKTVAVMTKAASERGDDFRETLPNTVSRTARHNLFDIQKGQIINGDQPN